MSLPALRFRDDDGQNYSMWEEKNLGDFLIPDFREVKKPNGSYLSIGVRSHCKGTFQKPDADPEKNSMDKLFVVHQGDVIVNITFAWEGAIAIVKEEDHGGYVSHRFPTYTFKPEMTSSSFFQNVFVHPKFRETLDLISPGGAGRNRVLSKKEFLKIAVSLPAIKEQTKIANFLTAVDEKITQLTQKYDLLTQYKKGVMQQIFSQELRFKDEDGQDFPEWETVGFGEIFSFKTTNSYSRECLNYVSGTVKNIHYGDIHTKFKSRFNITDERVPFINENISLTKINPDCFCVEGDLVIADASEDYKDIGKCIEIVNLGSQPVIAGLHTFLARPSTGVFSRGFMSHAMQSEAIRLQIMTVAQGTKVLSISTGRLSKVSIPLPEREEQTKIANFLTAIDDKITAAQTQLQAVKQYKQGLLQQMFV